MVQSTRSRSVLVIQYFYFSTWRIGNIYLSNTFQSGGSSSFNENLVCYAVLLGYCGVLSVLLPPYSITADKSLSHHHLIISSLYLPESIIYRTALNARARRASPPTRVRRSLTIQRSASTCTRYWCLHGEHDRCGVDQTFSTDSLSALPNPNTQTPPRHTHTVQHRR